MDETPFLVIDVCEISDSEAEQLYQFRFDKFQPDTLRTLAEESVYLAAFTKAVKNSLREVDTDFVRYVAGRANIQRQFTQKFLESVRPLVKQAVENTLSAMVVSGLSQQDAAPTPEPEAPEDVQDPNAPIIEPIQKEWLANGLELHDYKATPETRLKKGLALLGSFNNTSAIQISKGGGGNFNNEEIEKLASKLLFKINFGSKVQSHLRKAGRKTYVTHGKNKDTCIKEITRERNKLAHGEITFADCGQSCEFDTLRDIMNTTFLFMKAFVNRLDNYIQKKQYLIS